MIPVTAMNNRLFLTESVLSTITGKLDLLTMRSTISAR